ncbi:MAG TPA: DUF2125 domain-containing protein [Phenylobacterium sp.]|nr:DUF2125 domain-containing protein [Phenylobacterium sp.]
MPHPSAPRKPSRLGLYGPFILLLIFVAVWSVAWFRARAEVVRRLDEGAAALRRGGYELSWGERAVGGYPFRLDVTLTDAHIRDRSGWALQAPKVEAEAFMHAPTHWVVAAPQGLTFVRPLGGPVRVTGRLIRMSLSHFDNWPPNLSFEGTGLAFAAAPGATPFGLSAADRVEFHLRQAPAALGDEGGAWLSVTNGKARFSGLLGRIAGDKPISIEWDGRLSKMSALRGRSWADAVQRWTAAGGRMSVKRGGLTAGDALIGVNSGDLGVSAEGRLSGVLDVSLRQAPRALGELGATGAIPADRAEAAAEVARARQGAGDVAHATLNFEAGRTTLGPVAISPAPKVF